jgi:hypothetical protein
MKLNNENSTIVKWQQYLAYLREWTNAHSDAEYYGMSPVCFDEWLDNEYAEEEEEVNNNDN